jgi:transposase
VVANLVEALARQGLPGGAGHRVLSAQDVVRHPPIGGALRVARDTGLQRGVHQLVKAPIVLVWDRLNTHVSRTMGELIAERKWLTVFLLPAYSPDLNPVEGVWAHVKRSLANLAVVALDRLEALVRNRLKRLQYRPDTLDGFIAGAGLTLDDPTSP